MMLQRAKTYWRLFWKFRQIQLIRVMENRGDFLFWTGISIMWTIFHFFFFDVIVRVTGSIGGWQRYEIYVIMAVFTMFGAFIWSLFYYNMKFYTQMVFSGELNKLLLQPIDAQFVLMFHHNSYNNIFRFFIGVGMLIWSLNRLHYQPSLWQLLGFVVTLTLSFLFVYFLWFTISTTAFYFEKLDNINEIFPSLRRAWQVPRSIYTGIISWIFTTLIPVGLVTSIPAEIVLGKASALWIVYFAIITIVTIGISRRFFHGSLRRYVGQAN